MSTTNATDTPKRTLLRKQFEYMGAEQKLGEHMKAPPIKKNAGISKKKHYSLIRERGLRTQELTAAQDKALKDLRQWKFDNIPSARCGTCDGALATHMSRAQPNKKVCRVCLLNEPGYIAELLANHPIRVDV